MGSVFALETTINSFPTAIGASDTTDETLTNDLLSDDNVYYDVYQNQIMFLDAFNTSSISGTVSGVTLVVAYKVNPSYTGVNAVKWALDGQALSDTTTIPLSNETDEVSKSYDLFSLGVDTVSKISTLDIQFDNSGGNARLDFEQVYLVVAYVSPSFDSIADKIVDEDASAQNVPITNVDPFETATLSATSSDPPIIPNPVVSGSGATRTLTYTPAANANGAVIINVTAADGLPENNTFSSTFTITVNAVNDAPSFDAIANQVVNEDASSPSVQITSILPGPEDEAGQSISLSATSSNTALIPNPSITSVGAVTLTYQPAADASGTATITVTAQDNGGTANGGSNTSTRTFTITVNAVNDAPIANDDTTTTVENMLATITLGATDVDGDALTFTIVSEPSQGTLGDIIDNQVTYTPDADYTGPDSFTFNAYDGIVDSNTATISITVNPIPTSVYVDDGFSEGSAGGHTFGYDAFLTIQEGIDNVAENGTVNVAAGNYEESLVIDKNITLIGDAGDASAGPGPDAPVVMDDGSCSKVVDISASGVTISGFILDQVCMERPVVRLGTDVSSVTLNDNEILNGYRGVALGGGSGGTSAHGNIVENNEVHDNSVGVFIDSSKDNIILGNEIYANDDGIQLYPGGGDGDVSGNVIKLNNIHDNTNYGLYADYVTFNELNITNNNITSNDGWGVYFEQVSDSTDWLTIASNKITDNSYDGIYISDGVANSNVNISENNITGNEGDNSGVYIYSIDESSHVDINLNNISNNIGYGLYLGEAANIDITHNIIANNDYGGIYFEQQISDANDVLVISGNEIRDNTNDGIYINDITNSNVNISENNVTGNGVDDFGYYGIYINSADEASQVDIGSNNISENGGTGIYFENDVANVDVTNNNINNNEEYGINFNYLIADDSSDWSAIISNEIANNNYHGINIGDVTGSNVNISKNNITGNGVSSNEDEGTYHGIYIPNADATSKIDINSNNISENSGSGIYSDSQVTNVDVTNNNINNNGDLGIHFYQISDSTGWLTINSNKVKDNNNEGIWIDYVTSSYVNISGNSIIGNGRFDVNDYGEIEGFSDGDYYGDIQGINIYSADENSQVSIDSNNISENSGPGIYLDDDGEGGVTNVDIINNYIMNNNKYDNSELYNASIIILYALGNKAHSNRIIAEGIALDNRDPEPLNQFNATNNYWGSKSPDFDSIISGDANYTPWYIDEALTMLFSAPIGENETLADEEEETANENTTQIIVPIGSPIKKVIVNSTDASKDMNVSLANLKNASGEVTLVNNFTLTRQSSGITYAAEIPSGTVISGGSDWDGKINVPTVKNAADFSAASGSVDTVIDVGSGSEINFSEKVKVTIGGKAGKKAAWARGNSALTEITTVCNSATNPTNINAVSPRECYIDLGSDLVIWTYHFTQFAAVTAASSSGDSGGSTGGGTSGSSGSSGGGSCAPGYSLENGKCVKIKEKPAEKAPTEKVAEKAVPAPIETSEEEPEATSQPQAQQQGGLAGITGRAISALAKPNKIASIAVLILVLSGLYAGYYYLYRKKQ